MIPTIITGFCFILYAGIMSMLADRNYRYLIPSDIVRVLVTAGFCLVPGNAEALGNLCNLHRMLAPYLLFLALRPASQGYRLRHVAGLFLAAASAGEAFLYLPLFTFRLWQRFTLSRIHIPANQSPTSGTGSLRAVLPDLAIIVILLGWMVLTFGAREIEPHQISINPRVLLQGIISTFTSYILLEPTVGYRMSMNLSHHLPILFWIVSAALTFVLLKDVYRNRYSTRILVYIGGGTLFATQVLTWIARPGSITEFLKYAPGMPWLGMRECYTVAFAGYLLWSFFFSRISRTCAAAFILVYFLLMPSFFVPRYGDVEYWKDVATELDQSIKTGCPHRVEVYFFPMSPHWGFIYESPKTCARA
jgi:hypothetical protein